LKAAKVRPEAPKSAAQLAALLGGLLLAHALSVALVSVGCGQVRIRAQIEADAASVGYTIDVQIDATATKSSSRPVKRG